eukprot:TRINITY_DN12598_c0_g5_i2.p1 TRINITY_DN12598_c0_g5~~TRINITY_DN12598_c0_g5_i2.p1  ORF type:complete len:146 (+),score=33.94 TRINITY_DN12598_c0_g5_i2:1-438(+)
MPPVQCLHVMFAGEEMMDADSYADHGVEEGAMCEVWWSPGVRVKVDDVQGWHRTLVWPEETVLDMCRRVSDESGIALLMDPTTDVLDWTAKDPDDNGALQVHSLQGQMHTPLNQLGFDLVPASLLSWRRRLQRRRVQVRKRVRHL